MSTPLYEYTADLNPPNERHPKSWTCSLDLCRLDDGEWMGSLDTYGKSRMQAAEEMIRYLRTLRANIQLWILDEGERAFVTAYVVDEAEGGRTRVRIHMHDWNHGRGATAWSDKRIS